MSHYGPGGGYSDHPDDPHREQSWDPPGSEPRGGQPGYRPPADPWEQSQGSWADLTVPQHRPDPGGYDQPTHQQPSGPPAPYGQQPYQEAYHQPYAETYPGGPSWAPEPPRRRTGLVVGLVVLLVLVLAGGVGLTLFLVSGGEDDPLLTGDGSGASSDPSASGSPEGPDDPDNPEDRIGFSATVARADDCMVNDAGDAEPVMRIVPCDTDEDGPVYQVLARFDEQVTGDTDEELDQSAQQICASAEGYEYFYRFIGPTGDQSFVLCMVEH
jgi:hypothetical protein